MPAEPILPVEPILVLIVVFVLSAGLISTYVTGFTPSENHLSAKLTPPMTDGYILGSDGNGRDVLTRLAYGGRVSLTIASLAAKWLLPRLTSSQEANPGIDVRITTSTSLVDFQRDMQRKS